MELRKYRSSDLDEIIKLFHETVHSVNLKDYTHEQVCAWATGLVDRTEWDSSLLSMWLSKTAS